MNVVLRLTEAAVEFLWVGGVGWGGVCKVILVSNPTTVLVVLRCVVVRVVTISRTTTATVFSGGVS